MRSTERVITDSVVLGLLVFFVALAVGYPPQAKLVPLVVGVPALILMIAEYSHQMRRRKPVAGEAEDKDAEPRVMLRTELGYVAWFGWLSLGSYLLGFRISIPLFMFPILRFRFKQSLRTSVLLTAAVWVVLYVGFERLLRVPLDCGVLFHW